MTLYITCLSGYLSSARWPVAQQQSRLVSGPRASASAYSAYTSPHAWLDQCRMITYLVSSGTTARNSKNPLDADLQAKI